MTPKSVQDEIASKYLENRISINSLSREYGINRNTIKSFLKKKGIETKYFVSLPEEEIVSLYIDKRLTKEKIASMFGVSITPIRKIILRHGHNIRSSSEAHLGQKAWNKGIKWSDEVRSKIAEKAKLRIGNKNANWRGGKQWKGDRRRNTKIVKEWRKFCLARDKKCLWCGSLERLEVNHIIPIRQIKDMELLGDTENGITLCRKCHHKIHYKEKEFEDILRNLLIKSREFRETPTGHEDAQGQS